MSTFDLRAALISVSVGLACLACSDSDSASGGLDGDMFPTFDFGPVDAGPGGPDAAPGCTLWFDGRCIDDPEARCAWVAGLGPDCPDLDGDCFPDCLFGDRRLDCDDTRADVNLAAVERCTGLDDDCDTRVDEGYPTLGDDCDVCGQPGKVECAIDADGVACSAAPGQSEPGAFEPESCNGVDDDCDGAVDEQCAIDAGGPALAMPTLCPDGRVALVQDGALAIATPSGTGAYDVEVLPRDAPVAHPRCGAAGLAWLELGEAGCSTPAGGPQRCAAELWAMLGDAPPSMLAAFGSIGPPLVGEDAVYWHTIAGESPAVLVRRVGEPGAARLLDGPYSDPTPPVDGWMLVREWSAPVDGASTARAALVALEDGAHATLSSPGSGAGEVLAVARSAAWLAWLIGDASPDIWALRADTPRRGGFFPISTPGGRTRPHVVGERLVWLDPESDPPALRAFDLGTGVEQVLATGQIALDGFAVGRDAVVWVDEADGTLRRRGLAPLGE